MSQQALLGKTLEELQQIALEFGEPKFRGKQLAEWLYQKRATTIEEMTNLPQKWRNSLAETYCVGRWQPKVRQISADGTEKYLFTALQYPELAIETVFIPEGDRATLCVSSQVGCKMNCSFCATGKMGFQAQLTSTDILNQLLSVPHSAQLTNVVFMGMGEPLDNYQEVSRTLQILTSSYGFAWSPKRITLSTIAPKKGLLRLLQDHQVHLAISIHSPFPEERLQLMPVEKAFPITEVIEELRKHNFSGQRRLSFEYILFDGVNDSLRHAKALLQLLQPLDCRVNLIRYHAIPQLPYHSPSPATVARFEEYLNAHGLRCTTRRSRGEDISAACGMLSTQEAQKS